MRYEWRKIVTQRQLCALLLLVVMCDATLIAFNPNAIGFVNWQYVAERIVAKKAYKSITISLLYSYNVNEVYFDGIQLFREFQWMTQKHLSNGLRSTICQETPE